MSAQQKPLLLHGTMQKCTLLRKSKNWQIYFIIKNILDLFVQ
ncbi:MAG: hypothetical protein IJE50_04355 [Clostridia bacterium]|nr:hypothetical protein [Clostridia bacterium]MBQ4272210.1 hypothetical protein [Clostridia bacterium]